MAKPKRKLDFELYKEKTEHNLTVIAEDRLRPDRWYVRCKCGKKISIRKAYFGRTKSCGCMRRKDKKNTAVTATCFPTNMLVPKRRKFKHDGEYEIAMDGCQGIIIGRLINEYINSASFKIIKTKTQQDEKLVKAMQYRVVVKKKCAKRVEPEITASI